MQAKTVILKNESDTGAVANKLVSELKKGDVVALYGDLGVGKTRFVQFCCQRLGIDEYVSSPSFVLINQYQADVSVNHCDLFRLENKEEVWELGLEQMFENAITFIEWPRLAEDILPTRTIRLWFQFENEHRKLIISK